MTPPCLSDPVLLVVDRVEDASAAVELPGRQVVTLELAALPAGLREGDALVLCVVSHPPPTPHAREARLRVRDGRSFTPTNQERP